MKEDLKNVLLMGLGAMSLTSDKAKELKDELLKKGSEMYEKGKVANEELKHNIEDKIKENVTVVYEKNDINKDDVLNAISTMTEDEKKEVMNALKTKKESSEEGK